MRKVTEYELLRKGQYLCQHLIELSKELPHDDPERLGNQIRFLSSSIPAILILAANNTDTEYSDSICQINSDIEDLKKLLMLARNRDFLTFYMWRKWTEELELFGRMLTVIGKSYSYQPGPLSLTFTTEFYLQ